MARLAQYQAEALRKAEERIEKCLRKGGTKLDLTMLGLTALPDRVRELKALEALDIQENAITTLPAWLAELPRLHTLLWWKNGPVALPPWLPSLTALRTLHLGNSDAITGLPILAACTGLEELVLHDMALAEVPEGLRPLTGLKALNLTSNALNAIPDWLGTLEKLKALYLNHNRLTTLPSTFAQLTRLLTLDLRVNQFSTIPAALLQLQDLQRLDLSDTPLTGIPKELIQSRDAQKILTYARKLGMGEGRQPLMEAKMILVGRGTVGKTTLVHQLLHGRFKHTHKTKGIRVTDWEIPCPDGLVTAHVWDFGGQEIMHGTHQFFLTERSLYLLVLAGREDKEDEDAEYWLKMISAFGGGAPVIVVLNKFKEHRFEVDEEALREKYPNIVGFVQTDCRWGQDKEAKPGAKKKEAFGLAKLRKLIFGEMATMESARVGFPAGWRRIKELLPDRAKNFISYDDYRKVCEELGEKNRKDQDDLASILHILGVALNFRDDPRLRETSVLNRDWVTSGVYSLLNDAKIAERQGVIRPADLARVLDKDDYPKEKHDFLLRLMQKFELCYPLDGKDGEYLIPQLLTKKMPKLGKEFSNENCLCFEYQYPGLLPEGLLPRFIVKAYTRIADNLQWRSGVVLSWFSARALVRSDADRKEVIIRVHGKEEDRLELLSRIRDHFNDIHRKFNRLDPVEMVRVPGNEQVRVEYYELVELARARHWALPRVVNNKVFQVDVAEVLTAFRPVGGEPSAVERGVADLDPDTPVPRSRAARKEAK